VLVFDRIRVNGRAATPLSADQVFREHAATVHRWAFRLGGPAVEVDDVVQDVFVVVHQQVARFSPVQARLTTWLYEITQNVERTHRRKELSRQSNVDDPQAAIEAIADDRTPDAALAEARDRRTLYERLDQLPERDRTLLILFELERLSGEEIAELLGAKVGTVWVWLHRARKRFIALVERQSAEEARA
jgi:RNA polymerase sigma-70 factor (ECF subfamily)